MSFVRTAKDLALRLFLVPIAFSAAATNAAEPAEAPAAVNQSSAVMQNASAVQSPASRGIKPRGTSVAAGARLDLRVPDLRSIMSHSQLLDELRDSGDDEESIEIVAAPVLVPMSLDTQVPLGVVGSLQWSVDHPTQVWRILLPSPTS